MIKYFFFKRLYKKLFGAIPDEAFKTYFKNAENGVLTIQGVSRDHSRFCMVYAVWCALRRKEHVVFLGQNVAVSGLNEIIFVMFDNGKKLKGSIYNRAYVAGSAFDKPCDVLIVEDPNINSNEFEKIWYQAKKNVRNSQ